MSDPMQTPITGLPRPIHTPNPEFVKSQYEDKNENIRFLVENILQKNYKDL